MSIAPELVAPAGRWDSLRSAVEAGADAVYFGVKGTNLRRAAGNFDLLELRKVMDYLRSADKKGYLALNIIAYDHELGKAGRIMDEAKDAGVHAVILWDMGLLSMARERGLRTHLSTQASVSNTRALNAYREMGVERIVLARECGLEAIRNIIDRCSMENVDCGIEVFIHGAMCVSVSGRCFLSQHSYGRSANRGDCLQPCRRKFLIKDAEPEKGGECEYILGEDYLLSPRDLCTVSFIDRLIDAGITAFKIEGRMRPAEYVKIVTGVYRRAIDAYLEGALTPALKQKLKEDLSLVYNRGFDEGFYFGRPAHFRGTPREGYKKTYIGEVVNFYKKINVAEISVNSGRLRTGQRILVSGKNTPAGFAEVGRMEIDHKPVKLVEKGNSVGVKLPFTARPKDKVFLWELA